MRSGADYNGEGGPYARVTLPDGQVLDAAVRGRRKDASGTWWYELEATLSIRVDVPGAPSRAEPYPVSFQAAYPTVQPIAGESYEDVPGGPAKASWRVQRRRLVGVHGGPVWLLHREDCWAGRTDCEPVDTATAVERLRALDESQASPCDVCRPDAALGGSGR